MALTQAQLTAIKNEINADQALSEQPLTSDGHFTIAKALNLPAAPAWTVWKTSVPKNEVGKAFVASTLADITAGNNDKLNNFAAWNEAVDPSRLDQRQFFEEVFSVAAGAPTRAALQTLWRMLATRVQKVLSTGTGSSAEPATLASNIDQDYRVTPDEVAEARRA